MRETGQVARTPHKGGQVRTAAEAGPRHRRDLPEETTKRFQDNHAHSVHVCQPTLDLWPHCRAPGSRGSLPGTQCLRTQPHVLGGGECVPVGKHGARLFSQGLLNASHTPAVATPKRRCWGPGSPTAGGSQPRQLCNWGPSRCLILLSSWTHALPSCPAPSAPRSRGSSSCPPLFL